MTRDSCAGSDAGRLPADAQSHPPPAWARASPVEVVTLTATEGSVRGRYARSRRASIASRAPSARLGVEPGDRVGTFAWNNQPHFELYFAVPCVGAVLHTLNMRLFAEQLTYIVNHAEDRVIFVDGSLVAVLEQLAPSFARRSSTTCVMGRGGPTGSLPNVAALRGAARSEAGPGPVRVPRARGAPGRGPLLHERHDRQPEGRALLASLDQPAFLRDADDRRPRPLRARSGAG